MRPIAIPFRTFDPAPPFRAWNREDGDFRLNDQTLLLRGPDGLGLSLRHLSVQFELGVIWRLHASRLIGPSPQLNRLLRPELQEGPFQIDLPIYEADDDDAPPTLQKIISFANFRLQHYIVSMSSENVTVTNDATFLVDGLQCDRPWISSLRIRA